MLRIGRVLARGLLHDLDEVDVMEVERELPGVEPGHIQEVVDQRGERLCPLSRLHDELLGARAVAARHLPQREVELQLDRRHRRADLVARHAEELASLPLERAELGDVLEDRDRGDDLAVAPDGRRAREDVQVDASRRVANDDLLTVDALAAVESAHDRRLPADVGPPVRVPRRVVVGIVGRHDGMAEELLGGAVAHHRAVPAHDDDPFGHLVHDLLELVALG